MRCEERFAQGFWERESSFSSLPFNVNNLFPGCSWQPSCSHEDSCQEGDVNTEQRRTKRRTEKQYGALVKLLLEFPRLRTACLLVREYGWQWCLPLSSLAPKMTPATSAVWLNAEAQVEDSVRALRHGKATRCKKPGYLSHCLKENCPGMLLHQEHLHRTSCKNKIKSYCVKPLKRWDYLLVSEPCLIWIIKTGLSKILGHR